MLKLIFNSIQVNCDAPKPWGIYFQDSAAPQMEGLVELHDSIMFYLIVVLFGVGWILTSVIVNYASDKSPIVEWLGKSLLWVNTLSNFGKLLELLIPSNIWKNISGWSNYSGMVISQEICENKRDNRESKSVVDFLPAIVKEQRVDDNGQVNFNTCLRYSLSGFFRNSDINILSKQTYKRFFTSTSTNKIDHIEFESKMNPWFITGPARLMEKLLL